MAMTRALPRKAVIEAVREELDASPLVALIGPRGCGKTWLLEALHARTRERDPTAILQLEPLASTPEFLESDLRRLAAPLLSPPRGHASTSTNAFDAFLDLLHRRQKGSLLLLDDVTELRTLSYFPGVDDPLGRVLEALRTRGRAVVTSRTSFWVKRELPELPTVEVPPVAVHELEEAGVAGNEAEALCAATGGLVLHIARLAETMEAEALSLDQALEREISNGGRVEVECRAGLSELLHRARGYNACKAVLRVLAEEQGLKLTEIAQRMARTPGSARDYLRWLEEVDLLRATDKRFSFVDPLLRLWVRLYGRGSLPTESEIRREVALHLGAPTRESEDAFEAYVLPPAQSDDLVEID